MQVTSNYPTPPEDVNLRVISNYMKKFKVPIGFSDHTKNSIASLGAIALGATIIEKHFTLSRKLSGPDQSSSLEPNELKNWIDDIRYLETCMGSQKKSITLTDQKNISMKKILVIKPIKKGKIIRKEHLTSMRGAKNVLLPLNSNLQKIIGKKINYVVKDRRYGDPETVIAKTLRANRILGWNAKYSDIDTIIKSMWNVYIN